MGWLEARIIAAQLVTPYRLQGNAGKKDPISKWAYQLREKSVWQRAVAALANKNARILWAMFVRGVPFDARHVSVKPGAAQVALTPPLAAVPM